MIRANVRKSLQDFHLNLTIEVGAEILVLFGPSGAGKSTALQCLAGLIEPDCGQIELDGEVVFSGDSRGVRVNTPIHRRRIGYVFQDYALFPHMSVYRNISYGAQGRPDLHSRVLRMLEMMRLKGLEERYPHQLSGGQQQRVALARALMIEPRALLLDEPFSALDSAVREKLQQDLRQMHERLRLSTIYVTHNIEDAFTLGDRVAIIDRGAITQVGAKWDVFHYPSSRAVARYTGTKNIFDGEIAGLDEGSLFVRWRDFVLEASPRPLQAGQRVCFCIRPEDIMIVRPDVPLGTPLRENVFEGRIVGEIPRGATRTLFFRMNESPAGTKRYDFEIRLPNHVYEKLMLGLGKDMIVSLRKDAIHVMADDGPEAAVPRL